MSTKLSDTELLALAAIANNEAIIMAGDNQNRAYRQEPAMWSNGTGYMEATEKLRIELYNRGILS